MGTGIARPPRIFGLPTCGPDPRRAPPPASRRLMPATAPDTRATREYDLTRVREDARPHREPAAHQAEAREKLHAWFTARRSGARGGILVLPTGGGKTFTAIRFLCTDALSEGYKVLWLAHTHHLLEQAADAFGGTSASVHAPEVGWVAEPKSRLCVRTVSGTVGHCRIHEVRPTDDVVVCTLPTAARALRERHQALSAFLDAAGDRLLVVSDEAHHAPAPTYARLVEGLRERQPALALLGLTATPDYAREDRRGWLKRLFPQEIVYRAPIAKLMASRILARPHFEQIQTQITPEFSPREYAKWVSTYQDLPEQVITELAENSKRNDFVAETYLRDRARYGRTIIFADRRHQCDYLREVLLRHKVRADVVYSHVTTDGRGADVRNRRTADDNARVLAAFRRGELDVLINVRMLTEGTDVPNVQSVFLTRQTTSQVLLTQMVGRALRGPAFGGTEDAYIVSFVDEWQQPITWAEADRLADGGTNAESEPAPTRAPVQLLSIELIRRLSRELYNPRGYEAAPFLATLPVGWYQARFDAVAEGTEDVEQKRQLVLRRAALLALARHVGQTGTRPPFFAFAERTQHDLDALATAFITADLGPKSLHHALRVEFDRADRFWNALYPSFDRFERHYQVAQARVLHAIDHGRPVTPDEVSAGVSEHAPEAAEPSDSVKRAVLARDGRRCLCCGAARTLQVDHVAPRYTGGPHAMENLQTLCRACNGYKARREIDFRRHASPLLGPPAYALPPMPAALDPGDLDAWARYVRRTLNFFYACAAVQDVHITQRGATAGHWQVTLYPGNAPAWASGTLGKHVRDQIRAVRQRARLVGPVKLVVDGEHSARPARRTQ